MTAPYVDPHPLTPRQEAGIHRRVITNVFRTLHERVQRGPEGLSCQAWNDLLHDFAEVEQQWRDLTPEDDS